MSIPSLLTVNQLCQKHKAFTPGSIRWAIFNEHNNGLAESGAIVRLRACTIKKEPKKPSLTGKTRPSNGRVLIHEERFFNWLLSNAGNERKRA